MAVLSGGNNEIIMAYYPNIVLEACDPAAKARHPILDLRGLEDCDVSGKCPLRLGCAWCGGCFTGMVATRAGGGTVGNGWR
eukprot:6163482-Pleurochrysis_carterae.AAC.1